MKTAALAWLALGLAACAAPVMQPRTADVLDASRMRLRGGAVVLAMAESSAVLHSGNEDATRSGEYSDVWTARNWRSHWLGVDSTVGILFSLEGQVAYSPTGVCELGGLLSFVRLGAELRCGVLDEDWGAPFSAALSIAAAQQISRFIVELMPGDSTYPRYPSGQELRAGLDLSVRTHSAVTPLLNVNVGYTHQAREIQAGLPVFEKIEWGDDQGEIWVMRDELRLSLPAGIAFEPGLGSQNNGRGRVIVGVVTELTLWSRERDPPEYSAVEGSTVTDFEQVWALYLTLAGEVEWQP